MLHAENGEYKIPEDVMDSILIHQKDKILELLNDLEHSRKVEKFERLAGEIRACIILVVNLWFAFGYRYKADEITERIERIRRTHKLGHKL